MTSNKKVLKQQRDYAVVKSSFILKGTTLHAYCLSNNIDPARVTRIFQGKATGPSDKALRKRIITDSKAKPQPQPQQPTE